MEKARARGKPIGRPMVVDKVDAELVFRLRREGRSWREIAEVHPSVKSGKRRVRPSTGSIRRAWEAAGLPPQVRTRQSAAALPEMAGEEAAPTEAPNEKGPHTSEKAEALCWSWCGQQ